MATIVTATCSECFMPQAVEVTPRRSEITCQYCGHSVPMFQKHEMDAIRSGLAQDRRKMYIALLLFAGAAFLFGLYVFVESPEYLAEIRAVDGSVKQRVEFIGRDATSITVRSLETGLEEQLSFATILKDEIADVKKRNPLMTEDEAVVRAGEEYVKAVPPESSSVSTILVALSVLVGLAAIVFSAMASQDQLVCEF